MPPDPLILHACACIYMHTHHADIYVIPLLKILAMGLTTFHDLFNAILALSVVAVILKK